MRTANHRLSQAIDNFGAITQYSYYPEGTLRGTKYFLYDARGKTLRQWGSADYPVQYQYNDHNELLEMRTHRDTEVLSGTDHDKRLTVVAGIRVTIGYETTACLSDRDC